MSTSDPVARQTLALKINTFKCLRILYSIFFYLKTKNKINIEVIESVITKVLLLVFCSKNLLLNFTKENKIWSMEKPP